MAPVGIPHARLPLNFFALFLAAAFLFPACRKRDTAAGGDEFLRLSNVGQAHPTFAQLSFPPPEFSLAA